MEPTRELIEAAKRCESAYVALESARKALADCEDARDAAQNALIDACTSGEAIAWSLYYRAHAIARTELAAESAQQSTTPARAGEGRGMSDERVAELERLLRDAQPVCRAAWLYVEARKSGDRVAEKREALIDAFDTMDPKARTWARGW